MIVQEMMDLLCLDMVDKKLVTGSVTIQVGYSNALKAEPAKGTVSLGRDTNADSIIIQAAIALYERIVDPSKPVRRVNITCNNVAHEDTQYRQLSIFDGIDENLERNRKRQEAVLSIKKRYGKNAILKGMNLQEGATTVERNKQIGGHKSGK